MWNVVADFFFPPFCLICREKTDRRGELVCPDCWELSLADEGEPFGVTSEGVVDWREPGALYTRCAYTWNDQLGKIVHAFKYGGYTRLAAALGERLAAMTRLDPHFESVELLIPVPLARARRRERGYNQAERIAWEVWKGSKAEWAPGIVSRRGRSRSQTRLGPLERRRNVVDAFRVRRSDRLVGRSVLVVDDVVTTGATAHSLATVLLLAGASRVSIAAPVQASPELS